MTTHQSERLTLLSPAEQDALYGLPDFDDAQRLDYLCLDEPQLAFASNRNGVHNQVWCLLQIGYFKAKRAFFRFSWQDVPPADIAFLLEPLLPGNHAGTATDTRHEHYAQRDQIAGLFGYRLWAETDSARVAGEGRRPGEAGCDRPTFISTNCSLS